MKGAIIGDIVGSRFEYEPHKSTQFALFGEDGLTEYGCCFTDDTVMTVAVADALLKSDPQFHDSFAEALIDTIHRVARPYLYTAGFGPWQYEWIKNEKREPLNSYGNGSAMRVSSAGWYAELLEDTIVVATQTAEVTHNHPDGITGAQAVAACIWMARNGVSKDEIRDVVAEEFYYEGFPVSLSKLRPYYVFDATCLGSVPVAIQCFLDSESFEDAIRLAVSMGGDSDTMAAIAGSIAEAYYGVPDDLWEKAKTYLPDDFVAVVDEFYARIVSKRLLRAEQRRKSAL